MNKKQLIFAWVIGIILVGCSGINKKEFQNLYLSAKAIQGATSIGVDYQKFGELLQNLSTEVSIVKDKAKNKKEDKILGIYIEALLIYKDSATLWEQKIHGAGYDFIPPGRIFVEKIMEPIIERYKIPMNHHTTYWGESGFAISEGAIQMLWETGEQKIEEANSLFLGKSYVVPMTQKNDLSQNIRISTDTMQRFQIYMETKIKEHPEQYGKVISMIDKNAPLGSDYWFKDSEGKKHYFSTKEDLEKIINEDKNIKNR